MSNLSPEIQARFDLLTHLLGRHSVTVEDFDYDCEEDLRPYYEGDKTPAAWCVITKHGDSTFFYPDYHEFDAAQLRAMEYVNDNTYSEQPVEIVNLDTGAVHRPAWDQTPWEKGMSYEVTPDAA